MSRSLDVALRELRQTIAAATLSDSDRVIIVKQLDAFDRDYDYWIDRVNKRHEALKETSRRDGLRDVKDLIDVELNRLWLEDDEKARKKP